MNSSNNTDIRQLEAEIFASVAMAQQPMAPRLSTATVTSFSRCPAICLYGENRFNIVSTWVDAIVATRTKSACYRIYARKLYETMCVPESLRWTTLERWKDIRTADDLIDAIGRAENYLDLSVDWEKVVTQLAELDHAFASEVAEKIGLD